MDTGEIMGGHYRGSLYRETRAFPLLSDSAYQPTPALVCPSCDLPNTVDEMFGWPSLIKKDVAVAGVMSVSFRCLVGELKGSQLQ